MASDRNAKTKTKRRKVIVTCAVTGSVHTPSMTPYLPITPDEIARESIAAAEAGASVIHLHARDPKDGRPTPDPAVFMQFLPRIKQSCDAVINITTGGSLGMSIEDRLAAPLLAKPELCSLNMGSMNFGIFHAGAKISDWKHDWEKPYIEKTRDVIVSNTFNQIQTFIERLGKGCGTRFECECYDVGHLYTLAHFLDQKLLEPPLFVQTIFGVLGGIGRIRVTSRICGRRRTGCSATTTNGPSSPRASIRCRSSPWERRWAAMSASDLKTASTWDLASWRKATPSRCPRSAASSTSFRSTLLRQQRRARC